MSQLTIIANIVAKQSKTELVKNELIKLIDITRQEAGCINYVLHQDNEKPAHFLFYENWESREHWQVHMNNQHLKDYMDAVDGAIEDFRLNEMTLLG